MGEGWIPVSRVLWAAGDPVGPGSWGTAGGRRGRGTRRAGAWRKDGARGWGLLCCSPAKASNRELCGVGEGERVHDL